MEGLEVEEIQTAPQEQWVSGSNGGSKLPDLIADSGISLRIWRLYAYFWLVCLFFPILSLVQTPPVGYRLLVASSGLAIFTTIYFWVMWPHPINIRASPRFGLKNSLILTVSLTILVLLLSVMYGSAFLWLFIGVSAIAGITLPFSSASVAVFSLTLLTLGAGVEISGGIRSVNWLQIILLALLVRVLGLDMIGFVRLSNALRELHIAREELARQAVTEERFRMARDLHDLLGHTLSLITLKSELAGRLLAREPLSAAHEIQEVERVARQALREMREVVAGYRQQTLRNELDGARQILEAAGVTCIIEYADKTLPTATDAVLAWAVREGVTNVIRHSRAGHCLIRISSTDDYARAEVINDGSLQEDHSTGRTGSGLSGLAERVAEQGGYIEAGPQEMADGPGFRLWVEIPVRDSPATEVR